MATSLLHLQCYGVNAKPNLPPLTLPQRTNLFVHNHETASSLLKVTCKSSSDVLEKHVIENGRNVTSEDENRKSYTCVMKFGGSSVASAERIMEVASLVMSFPKEIPIVVLSAMGKTTNKLLLVLHSLLLY